MIIGIDFDGVIASYSKFSGKRSFGYPVNGAKEALETFKLKGHKILINTTRLEIDDVISYLNVHGIPYDYINSSPVNQEQLLHPAKQFADIYIDDRAINFNGNWNETVDTVEDFSPWWKKVVV